jgi:hypothetical protein
MLFIFQMILFACLKREDYDVSLIEGRDIYNILTCIPHRNREVEGPRSGLYLWQ